MLSLVEHRNKMGPYLKDIINNLKNYDTWKIQSAIANNFISSIDDDKVSIRKKMIGKNLEK